jgi:cell division protein FtsB
VRTNGDLSYAQAVDILNHVVTQKERWGKQYNGSEMGVDTLMDALIVFAKADNEQYAELKAELSKANRQLAAANARETKLKKQIETLKIK